MTKPPAPQRDSDYYFPDGNVVLRVEDTLFKVHKFILSRDSSVFGDMFSIPQPKPANSRQCCEGDTDENPIQLPGDTSKEFRALLWSLYALPAELFRVVNNQRIFDFVDIACMAHKYQFFTTEEWAIDKLKYDVDIRQYEGFTTKEAEELTKAAVLGKFKSSKLYDLVMHKVWKKAIAKEEPDWLAFAIIVSEKYGLGEIQGIAYYNMMLKGRDVWESQTPALDRKQRIRLLNGHYTLLALSADLPNNPPTYTHFPTCTMNVQCSKYWQRLWKVITEPTPDGIIMQIEELKPQPSDYLKNLMVAESIMKAFVDKSIPPNQFIDLIPLGCLQEALKETRKKVRETRLKLADFFVDVE